jgi:hypothetical protein
LTYDAVKDRKLLFVNLPRVAVGAVDKYLAVYASLFKLGCYLPYALISIVGTCIGSSKDEVGITIAIGLFDK